SHLIELRGDATISEQRLELRCEHQVLSIVVVEEWLDAQPVPGQEQPAAAGVPDGEREHAVELRQEIRTVLLVQAEKRLGIRARPEAVATPPEILSEALVVVTLAVVGDPDTAVGTAHGLMAGGRQVDDRQPSVAQTYGAGPVQTRVVGPSMREQIRHPA